MTSQAMLRTTVSDMSWTTRRAMRSTCSSLNSPAEPEAAEVGVNGASFCFGSSEVFDSDAHDGVGSGIGGGGGAWLLILSRSSKLNFGNAFVSPAGAPGCSSHSEGEDEVSGGVVLGVSQDGGCGVGGGGGVEDALSRSSNDMRGNARVSPPVGAGVSQGEDGRASAGGAAGLSTSSKLILGNARVSPVVGAGSSHGDEG